MRRRHLFEFEDQRWLPAWLRDALTDHLAEVFRSPVVAPLHEVMADRICAVLEASGRASLIDLCSGAGGPLPEVVPLIEGKLNRQVSVALTDLYPHRNLAEGLGGDPHFAVELRAVDARSVPRDLRGVRVAFNAIHHFRPDELAQVLRSATAGGESMLVFEPFERRPVLALRLMCGGFREGWRRAGRARGTRSRTIGLHLFLPIVLAWDGCVSVLRGYTADELLAIATDAAPVALWRSERVDLPWGGLTVLIGESGTPSGDS
jgi:hypothetical protein